MDKSEYVFNIQISIINTLGYSLDQGSVVLDLGCGNGELVMKYRNNGYGGFGCDLKFKQGVHVDFLQQNGSIRLIDADQYRIPFDNNTFDMVVSSQVFEHVQDYPSTLSEIKRVLKPGGISLHSFPSRYKLMEPHVAVPFATLIQSYWWLLIWAYFDIRKQRRRGISAKELARGNYDYLRECTNYLTKEEIRQNLEGYFNNVMFCEGARLKHTRRGKYIYPLVRKIPLLQSAYSAYRGRLVFFQKACG